MPFAAQSATQLSEAVVLAALRDCYHPELALNLVDLGTVERVAISPDADAPGAGIPGVPQPVRVSVELVLPPAANDATNAQISAIVCNRLAAFEGVRSTDVVECSEPAWMPDRISPAGRAQMEQRIAPKSHGLIQIQR